MGLWDVPFVTITKFLKGKCQNLFLFHRIIFFLSKKIFFVFFFLQKSNVGYSTDFVLLKWKKGQIDAAKNAWAEKCAGITAVVKSHGLTKKSAPTLNQIKICLKKHFGVSKTELSQINQENVDTKWNELTNWFFFLAGKGYFVR